MILFTRVEARDACCSIAVSRADPERPAPDVRIQFVNGLRTMACSSNENVILTHTIPVPNEPDEVLVLPGSVLEEVEGGTDEGVKLDRRSKYRGELHWHSGDKPCQLPVELLVPGKQHTIPACPEFTAVAPELLTALHECGRTTARVDGRYALSRIQVQGRPGRVIGTDSHVALVANGFTFPFTDDLLVPALPVFGSKPLVRAGEARIGSTSTHLVVGAGPWSVWLPLDTKGRYPDVLGVLPRKALTVVQLDDTDVVELLQVLSALPGQDDDDSPVTIDIGSTVTIRGRDAKTSATREVALPHATVRGPSQQIVFNRRILTRALSLGCRTLKFTPDKPVMAEGERLLLFALPLDPSLLVPPNEEVRGSARVLEPISVTPLAPPIPTTERSISMPPNETNGHTPPRGDQPDPLIAAEELRDVLADAHTKSVRLVAILKAGRKYDKVGRKQDKVLASIFANLKQLGLDSGGSP
ncbi:MAG: hypothetical protein U0792_22745 [Gemmataceae bacterium]